MSQERLGEFESKVLLAIARLRGRGYGPTIAEELRRITRRSTSMGAVYATLDRLENKGLISSKLGEPTPERGGRPKRFYAVEAAGRRALSEAQIENRRTWGPPIPARAWDPVPLFFGAFP